MPTRLWMDGCFDGCHFAHANAIRQCLQLVDDNEAPEIFVGVHSDAEILRNKGPTLFEESERYATMRGCRWVSAVVEDVPYTTQIEIIDKYNIDFVVHGDDPVLDADGNDCYGAVKAAGRYKECKRTGGISTTSLIARILRPEVVKEVNVTAPTLRTLLDEFAASCLPSIPIIELGTTGRLPSGGWSYIGGSWDCFSAGHLRLLEDAQTISQKKGGRLLVGVWDDEVVAPATGERPLLNALEQALALAQCRYVDGVLLQAPRQPPVLNLSKIGVSTIFHAPQSDSEAIPETQEGVEFIGLSSPKTLTVTMLRERIERNAGLFEVRQLRKGG